MLYQADIFQLLKNGDGQHDREFFFIKAIMLEAHDIAKQLNGKVRPAPLRLAQAQDYWERDVRNFGNDHMHAHTEDAPIEPDEFKQSAYLAYWLRRRIAFEPLGDDNDDFFLRYVNELIAFTIGFRLCHFHQNVHPAAPAEQVRERIRRFRLQRDYLNEMAVFLHHKNVSPHALYLVYRGMFEAAIPPAGVMTPRLSS